MSDGHFDVLIVGAGLSGVGAACHLERQCPSKSYAILESRGSMGGTWDLFRYPGIRSDSDMHTLGYNFKPWTAAKSIADGPAILQYVKETAADYHIDRHIRYHHRVVQASWSSPESRWTVDIQKSDTDESTKLTCNFLLMCPGYYNYEAGFTPEFEGVDQFQGAIIHPQHWPEALDYQDKRVIVIGSGATAVTLVPAMAKKASNVVMLQRSPTYVVSSPDEDPIAKVLRKYLPSRLAYSVTRWKNTAFQQFIYRRTRKAPDKVKQMLLNRVRAALGSDYDIETHFTPRYNPWDQRICLIPNGDLFAAIRSGDVTVVTDEIDAFTESGIRLKSGGELEADVIVTATGLELAVLGDVTFCVDGRLMDLSNTWSYKGLMYSDVPNMISCFGYINASWTLRADLTAEYLCRLLHYMDATNTTQAVPRLREVDRSMPAHPWIEDFSSGYLKRSMHKFPKQGIREPWINPQNYSRDKKMFRRGSLDDGVLTFSRPRHATERSTDPREEDIGGVAAG